MLKFNDQLKEQLGLIIESIQGKIQRAKDRKLYSLVKDPNIYALKGRLTLA